ncbi:MAG: hypothetical protein ACTSWX_08265 [Promethearchaeota archaeon]
MAAELQKQAEDYQKKSKEFIKNKNYEKAIEFLKKSKKIYKTIGFNGEVALIEQEIQRFSKIFDSIKIKEDKPDSKAFLDKKADELESELRRIKHTKEFEKIISIYSQLKDIYKKLNYKFLAEKAETELFKYQNYINQFKMTQNINKSKPPEPKPIIEKKQIEKSLVKPEKSKVLTPMLQIKKSPSASFTKKKNRSEIIKEMKKKKELEQQYLDNANSLLDKAQFHMKKKEFDLASKYYEESSEIFKEIGWIQQATMLKQEVQHMQKLKEQHYKKLVVIRNKQQKEQEMFESRVSKIIAEKEEKKRREQEALKKLPPEIQRKIEIAETFLKKTENLESKGKIEKCLIRYKYLLELYNEIPVSDEQKERIKEKIKKLENVGK